MFNYITSLISNLAVLFPAFIIVFTVSGFFKAFVAKIMGDDTGEKAGFLSLNPVNHIDFFGLLIMLLILFIIGLVFGSFSRPFLFMLLCLLGVRWRIPVPIIESNFKKHTLGIILTTIAGSLGNFLLALFFIYFLTYFPVFFVPKFIVFTFVEIFNAVIELAIFFGVLNLIPIPPFDAGRLLNFILPQSKHHIIDIIEEYSLYVVFALFFIPPISNIFFKILLIMTFFVKHILLSLVV